MWEKNASSGPPSVWGSLPSTMKVVMVDDSAADRKLFRILLEEKHASHLEFLEEPTATRGLETCRAANPDCVLLDYKLPDMTGLEFLAQLRNSSPADLSGVAVVMLTGLASEQVAVEALKNGAQDYLVKDRITAAGLGLAVIKATEKVGLIRSLKTERDRLSNSLAEKDVLLREVHHRVKNNLQVIASLLRMQANAIQDGPADGPAKEALRESQHRVESMALIHEQLYETEDLREVNVAQHASMLVTNLFHAYGIDPAHISSRVSIEPMLLEVDRAIPAGLILNELISNSLKHAFPKGRRGSIAIEGGPRDGRIVLEVRDDGIGFSKDADFAKSKSLGLQIVGILTRQLKGNLEMEGSHGASFRITFPERE